MKNELKSEFAIMSGKMEYLSKDFAKEFNEFKKLHENKIGEVTYKIQEDSVEHHQHKWYRGFLLPPIARESYNNLLFKAHLELKKMFLFREVKEWEDIPKKFQSRCFPVVRTIVDNETGEVEEILCGYLPSTANLNYNEMKEFILQVENFMAEFLQIGWTDSNARNRERAFE